MQLQTDLWIEGAYYIDFDVLGQLRIVGPNNHLHFGSVGLYRDKIKIDQVYTENEQLVIAGAFLTDKLFLHDPAVGHIQKVRHFTQRAGQAPLSFETVLKRQPGELSPNYIAAQITKSGYEISYKRLFQRHWYGVKMRLAPDVNLARLDRRRGFTLTARTEASIGFTIVTDTDNLPHSHLEHVVIPNAWSTDRFEDDKRYIDHLLDRTAIEITHLVKNNKTSGFEYGTVFPRDWMESADLGEGDLETAAISYMYEKAFEYVNPQGVGWHENIVGEFEFEKEREVGELSSSLDDLIDRSSRIGATLNELISQVKEMYVIRNMVDIEPRYVLGLDRLDRRTISPSDLERIKRVARYTVMQAESNDLITFKKMPTLLRRHKHDEYFDAGNWRDSKRAFKKVHQLVAPYDVNVVFYPQALALIKKHAKWLEVDPHQVERLVQKWDRVRDWYRFRSADGRSAFALALYDIKPDPEKTPAYKQLAVSHLDEAYDLFYGQPLEADLVSFCQRLLSRNYFYTPSGPTVVGAGDGYATTDYHGRVIWTKQTAYVIAGLDRQLAQAKSAGFKPATSQLVRRAMITTAKASIKAFLALGGIPELHYDLNGQAHFYNDQPDAEGPMNKVQLWSAVGARRIIRTYAQNRKPQKALQKAGK